MPDLLHRALALMERTFRSKPLVFFLLAWVAGIRLADFWVVSPLVPGMLGLLLVVASAAARWRLVSLLLLLLGMTALGLGATRLAERPPTGDVSEWAGQHATVFGVVDSEPVLRCNLWRCYVRVETVARGGKQYRARGRVYLRTERDLGGSKPGGWLSAAGVLERPSPARNPGGFSRALWQARNGSFSRLTAKPHAVVLLSYGRWDWRGCSAWLRQRPGWLRHQIAEANRQVMGDQKAAALVNSLLFGDLDQDDAREWSEAEERFRRAGLSHVLVVSGAQVALVFGLLYGWRYWALHTARAVSGRVRQRLRQLGAFPQRTAWQIGFVLLVLYVLLAGLETSVLRAALVAGTFFVGRCLDRESDPENNLAAAALLLLVLNPLAFYDVGGQLSFAATWAIIRGVDLLAPLLGLRRDGRPMSTEDQREAPGGHGFDLPVHFLVGSSTLAALLAVTPLLAQHFQQFSWVALPANLVVCGLATVLLPLGILSSLLTTMLVACDLTGVAQVLSWPAELLGRWINATVDLFARPEWAQVPIQPPGWPAITLYAVLLVAASLPATQARRGLPATLVCAALLFLGMAIVRPAAPVRVPTLTFIDVGQGDACLIRLPSGANVLVDGGGSPRAPCRLGDCIGIAPGMLPRSLRIDCLDVGRDVLARYLRYEHVQRLDLLVLTHPHDDHLWGLNAVLDRGEGFDVRAVLDAGRPFDSIAHSEWAELLRRKGLIPIAAWRGRRLSIGDAELTVLHPPRQFMRGTRSDENNNSVVLRLDLPGSRVLLTGDAEAEAEVSMSRLDLRSDVLKVGHHGSATSTSEAWLERVRPRIAVISCSPRNPFGHPRKETLDRLRRWGAQVYRTDEGGAVTLELHQRGWTARRTINATATRASR